ncbi:MAG: hypothetical protein I3273_02720 [Candidatus Moeniiplasma glomeromycotorum]|nr:hypothetical protein [Candidatus Moeniiplasma glomeromycotorum]MCE8169018.1 hypothetical protein [Candidatus Moeniiplasma glomeromycotorum]
MNVIENLPSIIRNLTKIYENEKWKVIFEPILREWGWKEYLWCRRKEIEKYRNDK